MNDEISPDLVALYRATAAGEPCARVDTAILKSARRRDRYPRAQVAALILFLASAFAFSVWYRPAPPPSNPISSVPLAMDVGDERFLAIDAKPQMMAIAARHISVEGEAR